MIFHDRENAGQLLAEKLRTYQTQAETVILALPRGGVAVGAEIARVLNLPLDILIPRKIGHPENPEYAIGALTETGEIVFNEEERTAIDPVWLKQEIDREKKEAKRRLELYRGDRPASELKNKTVIIVDDGLATGLTVRAAIAQVRRAGPAKIVVAVPVAALDSAEKIKQEVDEFVALETPLFFGAVGAFYQNFPQVSDAEVIKYLESYGSIRHSNPR